MSNDDQQNQSTEFESETNVEEPPSFEETLDVLDKVFDNNNDGIDAAELLAEAEIDFSTFFQRVQCQMEQHQKTVGSYSGAAVPLERLGEIDLDLLSDEDVLSYLHAEGIDCEHFISKTMQLISTYPGA